METPRKLIIAIINLRGVSTKLYFKMFWYFLRDQAQVLTSRTKMRRCVENLDKLMEYEENLRISLELILSSVNRMLSKQSGQSMIYS